MSERQIPERTRIEGDISLSAPAAAVLEFTSDIGGTRRPGELTYITSKDAYIWAGVATLLGQYISERKVEFLEDLDIQSKIYYEMQQQHLH
jgi:hypothetical protein